MPRITVNVDEETEAWLQEEADRLNWSKADAGGECISLIQSAVGHIDVQQSDVLQSEAQYSDEVRERLDELEQRVAMLEQGKIEEIRAETGVEPSDATDGAHGAAVPVEGEDDPNPSPDASSGRGSADGGTRDLETWLDEGPPHEEHAKDAIRDLVTLLEEHGTMKTGDLKDELYERHGDHYGGKDSMWESIRRYLDEVPGVEKGGYGKYTTED
jgi:hypothetical protein